MAKIEIYTKDYCPYCHRAKDLLRDKGLEFQEYDVANDSELEMKMRARSGRRTVPQIFIDDIGIGGFDDMAALDRNGELDRLTA